MIAALGIGLAVGTALLFAALALCAPRKRP